MDPLDEILQDLRLVDGYYCHSELRAPWGVDFPDLDWAGFHYVAEGRCCVLLGHRTLEELNRFSANYRHDEWD